MTNDPLIVIVIAFCGKIFSGTQYNVLVNVYIKFYVMIIAEAYRATFGPYNIYR